MAKRRCIFGRHRIFGERGGALIELGLILPVLAMMAVAATNVGLSLSDRQVLVEATRYAARRAIAEGVPRCARSVIRKPGNNLRNPIGGKLKPGGCAFELMPENEPDPEFLYADQLAELYACQLLRQSGLDITKWRADAETVSAGAFGSGNRSVRITLTPIHTSGYFTSALMGETFPSAEAEFLLSQECGAIIF